MRDRIKALLDENKSYRAIGRVLNIQHTKVSREVARNSYGDDGRTPEEKRNTYDPTTAQHKADKRRRDASWQGKKIEGNHRLRSYVIERLQDHWSPDEIAGHMKKHKACSTNACCIPDTGAGCSGGTIYASKNTIYEWLRSAYGQQYCLLLYSKRYRRKPHRQKKVKRETIPERVGLEKRPAAANDRSEPGHWEKDAVVSSKRSGSSAALSVDQERTSRYIHASIVSSMRPHDHVQTTMELLRNAVIHSITYDNGIENRYHTAVHRHGVATYFTDPYSSWQKGSVEHANKMLRRYFPKGTDFSIITPTAVDEALTRINNKPRKILGYTSSLQVAKEKGVLLG